MNNILAKLSKIPGCTAFVLAYRATGDQTALIVMCDWLEEHEPQYAPECNAIRAAFGVTHGQG